jgi:hypothetical protein
MSSVLESMRESVMPEYRFYTIRSDGHIAGPPTDLHAPDDREAVNKAHQLLDGRDIEIWQGPRVVAYVVPDKTGQADGGDLAKDAQK